jgi:hypothetical protein
VPGGCIAGRRSPFGTCPSNPPNKANPRHTPPHGQGNPWPPTRQAVSRPANPASHATGNQQTTSARSHRKSKSKPHAPFQIQASPMGHGKSKLSAARIKPWDRANPSLISHDKFTLTRTTAYEIRDTSQQIQASCARPNPSLISHDKSALTCATANPSLGHRGKSGPHRRSIPQGKSWPAPLKIQAREGLPGGMAFPGGKSRPAPHH